MLLHQQPTTTSAIFGVQRQLCLCCSISSPQHQATAPSFHQQQHCDISDVLRALTSACSFSVQWALCSSFGFSLSFQRATLRQFQRSVSALRQFQLQLQPSASNFAVSQASASALQQQQHLHLHYSSSSSSDSTARICSRSSFLRFSTSACARRSAIAATAHQLFSSTPAAT